MAGSAVCDDGLVIDLSAMKEVRSTRLRAPAASAPGCLGRARPRDAAVRPGVPGGEVSTTGIAG